MNSLSRHGFFITPQILSTAKVEMLRTTLEEYFEKFSASLMPPHDFFAIPDLATIPFQPATVAALKAQLGDDYVTIPEYVVQADQFGGWHTDSGNQGRAAYCYHPDWVQIQCAVYLQDNDKVHGGGLDVRRGGHRERLTWLPEFGVFRRAMRRLYHRLTAPYSIPNKAGDLLGFHFRLVHRATPQISKRRKFAIFWVAAKNTPAVQHYLDHLKTYQGGQLDFEYSPEAINLITQQNLNVAGLTVFKDR